MSNKLKKCKEPVAVFILTIAVLLIFSQGVNGASLRAGVSKVNITRDNPTELVNDPLYARVLVLDDGKTKAVIITMDIINIGLTELAEIRNRIQNELKINGNNVMINASHNH